MVIQILQKGRGFQRTIPFRSSRWERCFFQRLREENIDARFPVKVLNVEGKHSSATVDIFYRVAVDNHKVPGLQTQSLVPRTKVNSLLSDASLALKEICHTKKLERASLSLTLCHDSHIAYLNEEYRGIAKPTDVLSFELGMEYIDNTCVLGDIIISLDTAARQAEARNHTLRDEFRILFVHGLLHLLGYDHERNASAMKRMESVETSLLQRLGWVNTPGLIFQSQLRH